MDPTSTDFLPFHRIFTGLGSDDKLTLWRLSLLTFANTDWRVMFNLRLGLMVVDRGLMGHPYLGVLKGRRGILVPV